MQRNAWAYSGSRPPARRRAGKAPRQCPTSSNPASHYTKRKCITAALALPPPQPPPPAPPSPHPSPPSPPPPQPPPPQPHCAKSKEHIPKSKIPTALSMKVNRHANLIGVSQLQVCLLYIGRLGAGASEDGARVFPLQGCRNTLRHPHTCRLSAPVADCSLS